MPKTISDDPLVDETIQEEEMSLVPTRPWSIMDKLDDNAILAELKGEVIQEYVYEIYDKGQKVVALSKKGVDAACAELAKQGQVIREEELEYTEDEEYAYFKAKASRYAVSPEGVQILLDSVWGVKRQWKMLELKDKSIVPNPFWFEQGAMKATRNARRRLIPEDLIAKLIDAYKGTNKTKRVSVGEATTSAPQREQAKPTATQKSNATTVTVKDIQEEVNAHLSEKGLKTPYADRPKTIAGMRACGHQETTGKYLTENFAQIVAELIDRVVAEQVAERVGEAESYEGEMF